MYPKFSDFADGDKPLEGKKMGVDDTGGTTWPRWLTAT